VVQASISDVAPNAIIDAVVYGKPFVCTADTGIRERLEGTGLFVDTTDEAALRGAIETLLDPHEYARIQKRVQNFSFVRTWDDIAKDITHIIANRA
jgi:glycosyltransferase involved in cell wall biosynthesis